MRKLLLTKIRWLICPPMPPPYGYESDCQTGFPLGGCIHFLSRSTMHLRSAPARLRVRSAAVWARAGPDRAEDRGVVGQALDLRALARPMSPRTRSISQPSEGFRVSIKLTGSPSTTFTSCPLGTTGAGYTTIVCWARFLATGNGVAIGRSLPGFLSRRGFSAVLLT